MIRAIPGVCLLWLITGCGSISRIATARIEINAGTNRILVVQPKDTVFKRLSFNPKTGAIEVTGYASAANAAAISAQQAQTEAITGAVVGAMSAAQASAEKMLSVYMGKGLPAADPPAVRQPPPLPPAAPRHLTNVLADPHLLMDEPEPSLPIPTP